MKHRLFLCEISCLLAMSFAHSQPTDANSYQGITVPASYSYHLAGRTDRIHGYVMKIDDASRVSDP